ncbi:MAG: cell division protein FtsA [Pseudomonadales bacterium]|nr:cell division protein FtsA [Pseudomonadales bacterium]
MIAALDIGTSKVVAIVARVNDDDTLEILGVGRRPSLGMRRGAVTHIDQTMQAIQGAVSEAELMADCRVHTVYVGIAGSHIGGRNAAAVVATREGEVTAQDMDRVIDAAKSGPLPADHRILHILPQDFLVDDQPDVRHPIGMSGQRLEGHIHVISCASNAYVNIEKCVQGCGLQAESIILEQLASGQSVLTEDERELGVCVVDIGAGTTDIAVFMGGAIRYTATIPIAGDQVTNDIAMALRTPTQDANELKIKYASALAQMVTADQEIEVVGMGDRASRRLSRQTLAEVVEPRYDELFSLVLGELERGDMLHRLPAGIVLTGGSSCIEGSVQLAESIFHLPVRIGMPNSPRLRGMADILRNPMYATGIGLLMYGQQELMQGQGGGSLVQRRQDVDGGSVVGKVRAWLARTF